MYPDTSGIVGSDFTVKEDLVKILGNKSIVQQTMFVFLTILADGLRVCTEKRWHDLACV